MTKTKSLRPPKTRMTRQRRVILKKLQKISTHPTADEVYEQVRKSLPRISLGTVYRNLEILCQWGLIQKLELAGTPKRFDGSSETHYHVRCTRCGRVEDVKVKPHSDLEKRAGEESGYFITGHRLKFLGLCPECS